MMQTPPGAGSPPKGTAPGGHPKLLSAQTAELNRPDRHSLRGWIWAFNTALPLLFLPEPVALAWFVLRYRLLVERRARRDARRRARAARPAAWPWWLFIGLCSAGIVGILVTHGTGTAAPVPACWQSKPGPCVDACSPPRAHAPDPCGPVPHGRRSHRAIGHSP